MPNRLAGSTSPYLLQHKDNPVDWHEWGDDAFDEARRRGVPILLSVGYAACHWCHVMAHESFEDAETARMMNDNFVNVKVDREERPDVDAVYMEATQAMTGHGGWPMTVFCTPEGQPFFCGTYFPPTPGHGTPSFRQLLKAVAHAWRERRDEIERAGDDVVRQLAQRSTLVEPGDPPTEAQLAAAVQALERDFDPAHAGFGSAPKFPPSMTLEQLLRHHARTGSAAALAMVERTAQAMARGGIYDQLGGGFARYSVDAQWVVPHFEKMLYDNALLLRVYVHWWRATGAPLAARVAHETADWIMRELRTPHGGFAASLDADSEGVEGKYYVWTLDELTAVLGPADAAWAAGVWQVTQAGSFEHGASVLQLPADPDDSRRYAGVRRRLLAARAARVPPARDDKVVASWNGLAIAALAEAGALLDRPDWLAAAGQAADLLLTVHAAPAAPAASAAPADGDRLVRTSRDGVAGRSAGVLDDYADVAEGLLVLYAVTGDPARLAAAGRLLDTVLSRFADGNGGFFDTADDAPRLVSRPQEPTDSATPSGQSAAAGALLSYAAYTGSTPHREAAERALGVAGRLAPQHPRFCGWALAVAEALVDGPREVAVVGSADDGRAQALWRTALQGTAPGAVVAFGDPARRQAVGLLAGKSLINGGPAAYVCRGFVCHEPVTDPAALAAQVGAQASTDMFGGALVWRTT
jgi:uncharacterized protein YyaL (SSP411 family)